MYSPAHHANYVERCKNWAVAFQNLIEEGERLRDIRQHEAENGAHADYVDTATATEAELESLSTLMDQVRRFEAGDNTVPVSNKRQLWTPFVQ